jgi:hypothetical protein
MKSFLSHKMGLTFIEINNEIQYNGIYFYFHNVSWQCSKSKNKNHLYIGFCTYGI